jgi:hypothetical protein
MNCCPRKLRSGHSLVELVVATIASTMLLLGLGSVMLIARQVAYTPSSAVRCTQAADLVHQMADELSVCTHVLQQQPRLLEFVVNDRNADGAAEKIRYEWSGTTGTPLQKTVNGVQSAVIQNVQDCTFTYDTVATATTPVVRTNLTRVQVKLQTGEESHSRIDAAIPLIGRPEQLAAFWRTDFDSDPTGAEADGDGAADWTAAGGATFGLVAGPGELQNGTWYANGSLATNPGNDFSSVTVVELRCKNMAASGVAADVLQMNADRSGGTYAPLVLRLEKQADGSQTLTLVGKPTSVTEQSLKVVDNLVDDYMRIRLTIQPDTNLVSLQVNEVGDDVLGGPFVYPTHSPTSTDRTVSIGGGAKFDYVEVRVLDN